MSEEKQEHIEHLIELSQSLAQGDAEEIAAAEVLCVLGACLEKKCVLFIFKDLIEAARNEAARSTGA